MTDTPQQTAVATTAPKRSVLYAASERFGMEPAAFEATLRGTVFPSNGTQAEFAAFLVVANEYGLNPMTREIYAYPKKGGGIQPIVSIDGWARIINEHPQFDGMSFEFEDLGGDPAKVPGSPGGPELGCTVTIWRKDRTKPTVVTEYLSECFRATDPWKMRRRMLRHKALIQGARYAFGFASIMDEDEAVPITETLTPVADAGKPARGAKRMTAGFAAKEGDQVATAQPSASDGAIDAEFETVDQTTGEVHDSRPQSSEAETQQRATADQASGQSSESASGQPADDKATGSGDAAPAATPRTAPLGSDQNPKVTPAEAAEAGVYFHVQTDPVNAAGQRPFYDEDGQARGWAQESHGIRVATDLTGAKTTTWAPQAVQEPTHDAEVNDAPWEADEAGGQDEAPGSPWDVFDAVLMSSTDWAQIRSAMLQLSKDPVWNAEPDAKATARAKTFAKAKALGIDPAKDSTAFQCFLNSSSSPDDITAIFGDAIREPWYTSMAPEGQNAVTRAVMNRKKELG